MRKLIYGINVSLDGCCDHTKFGEAGGDDIHNYFRELMEQTDTVLYGRKTYELMVPFWPEVAEKQSLDETANAFAKVFASLKRVVVSKTMKDSDDKHSIIISDRLEEKILKLKQQPGKAISTGGIELPSRLIELGLVDEFHMVVHPVIVGEGRRLFTEAYLMQNQDLKLVATKTFNSGCIALQYEKI